jgi:ABC-type transport system involved in cytochrome bd biosynthesis fused ATPase/permease subunit
MAARAVRRYSATIDAPPGVSTMAHPFFEQLGNMIEDIGRGITLVTRRFLRAIATMSWPQLAATCVLLAIALTIVPLALTLFVIFMCIKLVIGSMLLHARRNKRHEGN